MGEKTQEFSQCKAEHCPWDPSSGFTFWELGNFNCVCKPYFRSQQKLYQLLFCCYNKIPDQCILKTDGSEFEGSRSFRQLVSKQGENAAIQLLFFFSCGSRFQSTFRAGLSIPVNPLQKTLHRHVHRFVPTVILNIIKQSLWEPLYETLKPASSGMPSTGPSTASTAGFLWSSLEAF